MERELGAKAKGSEPVNGRSANGDGKAKQQRKADSSIRRIAQNVLSPVFVEAFVLTFLAEWGDRSQIATIGVIFLLQGRLEVQQYAVVFVCCVGILGIAGSLSLFPGPAGLAASIDVVGVSLGGILGHAICTGAAVLGGRQMAAHIREKTVAVRP